MKNEPMLIVQAAENNALWCDAVCRANGAPGVFYDSIWINQHHVPPFYPNAITLTPGGAAEQLALIRELAAERSSFSVKDSFAALDLRPLGFDVLFEATWLGRTADGRRPTAEGGRRTTDHELGEGPGSASPGGRGPAAGSQQSAPLAWSVVGGPEALARWEAAWAGLDDDQLLPDSERIFRPALLEEPGVAFLAGLRAGAIVAVAAANLSGEVVGLSNVLAPEAEAAAAWAGAVALASNLFPGRLLVGYEWGKSMARAQAAGFEPIGALRVWTQ
jgi:hypothetical protein